MPMVQGVGDVQSRPARKRGVIRFIPNLYESPAESLAEVDPYAEKVEKIGMTIPTVIAYAIVLPLIILSALSGTRVYTITCANGQCNEPGGLLQAARQQAGVSSSAADRRPVTLEDLAKFKATAAERGVPLTCPCRNTNIEFEKFVGVAPEQIGVCKHMFKLFYPPFDPLTVTSRVAPAPKDPAPPSRRPPAPPRPRRARPWLPGPESKRGRSADSEPPRCVL